MPRGDKSGNPRVKRHRAAGIARRMMQAGVPRAEAERMAAGAMDREYGRRASRRSKRARVDEATHDTRSGERKTRLSVKRPAAAGARKPLAAKRPSRSKRSVKKSGRTGAGSAGRRSR